MDRYNVSPHPAPESSCSQDRQESLLFPTATSKSYPRRFGHSVQTLNSPHCGYLNHHGTNQDTFDPQHTLDDHLILNLPPIETLSIFTELISQKDLDEIVPIDDLTCTDSTKADLQQTTQKSLSEHSPVTSPHSSLCPVTTTIPPVQPTQQQVHTETAGYQLTESFSGESPTITPANAYRRDYHMAYRRAYRAEMATSGDKDKAKEAAKAAGRAAGRAASRAQRERKKKSSADNQFLTISSREARIKAYIKFYHRAYTKAYKRACQAEISLSGNVNKAHKAGQAAGKAASQHQRECIQTSTDYNFGKCQPIPNFCDKSRELFTIPIEPISP